ncbi:MAG: SRPBCC domain-containing protein [Parvularculaceae bacterium]
MTVMEKIEPIVKTLSLNEPVDKAFRHFTANIHLWWPLAEHSLAKADAKTVIFEARDGGRIYEVEKSGKEREWGRILECDAPHRVVFSWVLEAPDKATEIEILFKETGEKTSTLTLIHRKWENRSDGAEWRGYYNQGWDGVLALYAETLA